MPIVSSTQIVNGEQVDVFIEVDELPQAGDLYKDTRDVREALTSVGNLFGKGLELTRDCASVVVEQIDKMDKAIRPSEFEVQLSIKLDSEMGAIIAKSTAGAQMQVTMKWIHDDKDEK